ncbi:MAG: arginine--tRNA ligase [Parcubacteria group bacterium]|nr:arginine--tRNA ligase [Parcubacteria group bacterium]
MIRGKIREYLLKALLSAQKEQRLPDFDALPITVERPNVGDFGDYASNIAMVCVEKAKKPAMEIADILIASMKALKGEDFDAIFSSIEAKRPGFINFTLSDGYLVRELHRILEAKDQYGDNDFGKGKKAIVEHTSVNPNKAMHVGHIRNAFLGDSLSHLLRKNGYTVEVHNYIDDTGVQVADIVLALRHFADRPPKAHQKFDHYCWDLYTAIQKAYEENPDLKKEQREILASLERGSDATAEYAENVVKKILFDHEQTLSNFDVFYDVFFCESAILRTGLWEIVFEILKKDGHISLETEGKNKGCWVMKNIEMKNAENMENPDKVLVTSGGNIVYTAKDLAYHLWKFGLAKADFRYEPFLKQKNGKYIYKTSAKGETMSEWGNADIAFTVVDERQAYPQSVIRSALMKMGYEKEAAALHHVSYGVVTLSQATLKKIGMDITDEKKAYTMSGRKGIGVKVDDLFDLLIKTVEHKKSTGESVEGESASSFSIANAALRAYMLKANPRQEVVFDTEEALQMTGDSGPYIQYTHARIHGILKKSKERFSSSDVKSDFVCSDIFEKNVLRKLRLFPEVVASSCEKVHPHLVYAYLIDLASALNTFYDRCAILKAPDVKVRKSRTLLIAGAAQVLKNGLAILGIEAPERM